MAAVYFLYEEFLYISFSEEAAKVSGIPVSFLNTVLVVLTAVTVSLAMRIVGLLLIGALMVIPVVTAMQIAKSFRRTLFYAVGFGLISVILGLFLSYYLGLAAGGTIVVISLILFGLVVLHTSRERENSF
jgi:zinc transport system permease protein